MSASPNPVLARWQWRLGHRRCSLTDDGGKYAGGQSDLEAVRQPLVLANRRIAHLASGKGQIDVKVGSIAHHVIASLCQLVRHRLDDDAIGLGALALLVALDTGAVVRK
jgi:hypothetical protein